MQVATVKAKPREREAYSFTVSRHGNRWYLSAKVPAQYGGHFTIAGFEITDKRELVIYNLDLELAPRPRFLTLFLGFASRLGFLKFPLMDSTHCDQLALRHDGRERPGASICPTDKGLRRIGGSFMNPNPP